MAKKRVAINGLGRIGGLVTRAIVEHYTDQIDIVAVNNLFDINAQAYFLKHDSVHGLFPGDIAVEGENLVINGQKIQYLQERNPEALPWKDMNIDVVLECTGIFTKAEQAQMHLNAGAKKVLISAPSKSDGVRTVVFGVNNEMLQADDKIISNASCTTNCLAPVAKVLHQNLGIEKGDMTTIHAYTNDQKVLDCGHSDVRRGRAAGLSMIPTSTGAARAVGLVLPELKGKLDGVAIRVPTPDVSVVLLTCVVKRDTSIEEVNNLMIKASQNELKGILGVTDEKLVSVDFTHCPLSSTFDLTQTNVIGGNLVKVTAWYDNEWGYSNRMADVVVNLL